MYIYVCQYVGLCILFQCLQRPEEDVGSPGAGGAGGSEWYSVDAGNKTWVSVKALQALYG